MTIPHLLVSSATEKRYGQGLDGAGFSFRRRHRVVAADVSPSFLAPITRPEHRMYLLLAGGQGKTALPSPMLTSAERPLDAALMSFYPVSTLVNSPRNNDPRCAERITLPSDEPG